MYNLAGHMVTKCTYKAHKMYTKIIQKVHAQNYQERKNCSTVYKMCRKITQTIHKKYINNFTKLR